MKDMNSRIIALSSELTCLHGRYELSPRGVALLRDMAKEARLALDPGKEMETKAVGRKPPDPNPGAEALWHGYRQADVIVVQIEDVPTGRLEEELERRRERHG